MESCGGLYWYTVVDSSSQLGSGLLRQLVLVREPQDSGMYLRYDEV